MPDGLTQINQYTFQGCKALQSARFPADLISIGMYAFDDSFRGPIPVSIDLSGCAKLTTINTRAFFICTSLTDIALPTWLTSIGQAAFAGSGIVSANWSDLVDLTTLGQEAFMGCGELNFVILTGTGLTTIDTNTFYGCTGLEIILLPDNMTSIADNTFGQHDLDCRQHI